jgi:nitroimidazol reductase NimA-like FMN-containing flavoprotein (pyridoxamine 5'-phosphate oxidase superfamily)
MTQYHLLNRPNREITSEDEVSGILKNGKFAVISLCRGNEPYVVTLSYGYDKEAETLYFHTSKVGLKLEFLRENSLVCATVIEDGGYVKGVCEHVYKTAVFWGRMGIVSDAEEKKHGMNVLLTHLEQEDSTVKKYLLKAEGSYSKMEVLKLKITQIHGKAGK